MKFLSDILAKAGLVVDGVVQFNNTATGQTPASGDNSTKLATTAFIKNQNYLTGNQTITITGDATGSGTTSISLTLANTGVVAGQYGSSTSVPVITVDAKGRVTSVSTASISGSLTFIGDVTGTGTTGSSTTLTLANSGVTAGTYTKVTVDAKGRVTSATLATTSDISEGTNLYYTDGRVATYLTANGYATQSYVTTQINNLINGAPGLLDTLDELAAALGDDPNFATTVTTALSNRLRIDIGTQGLTSTQQGYGRTNLGLGALAVLSSIGDAYITDLAWSKLTGVPSTFTPSAHTHDDRYYTETEIANFFSGSSVISGYNKSNWDAAYGWGNHASAGYLTTSSAASTYVSLSGSYANPAWITSLAWSKITGAPAFLTSYTETDPYRVTAVAVSGSATKTITITRADNSTVTTTWTDYDTDTNTYVTSASFSGGTLTLTRNDAGTISVSLDGRYQLASTAINTSNIGSQSVSYATSSGTAANLGADYTADDWFRATADNNPVKFYGNSYQMTWRTDGSTEAYSGIGNYPYVWSYGGSSAGNRLMLISTSGQLWLNSYGWLHDYFQAASTAITTSNIGSQSVSYATSAGNANTLDSLDSSDFMRNYGMLNNTDVYVNFRVMRNNNSSSLNDGMYIGYGNSNSGITRIFGGGATSGGINVTGSGVNDVSIAGSTVWNAGNLTNLNQLTNGPGYITSYTETDTLASVTGRGATTSSPITINGGGSQPLSLTTSSGSPWHLALVRSDLGLTSRVFAHNSPYNGWYFEHNISIAGNTNWHSGNLTNLNQLSNGPGYITGESDTLSSVISRGNTTGGNIITSANMYASVFYDYANNGYYGDFAGTSNMYRLQLGGGAGGTYAGLTVQAVTGNTGPIVAKSLSYATVWSILPWSDGDTYMSTGIYYDNGTWVHASSTSTNALFRFRPSGPTWYSSNNSSPSWNLASDAPLWNSVARWVNNVTAPDDVRAPIFYDSNDTGYYLDPNSESKLYRLNVGGGSHTLENNQAVIKFRNTVDNHNYIVSEGAGWGSWHQWIRYVGSYNTWRIGTFDAGQESGESMWRLAGKNRGSNAEVNYIVAGPRGAWGSNDRVILWNPYARYDGGSYNGDGTHHALLMEDKWWNGKYFGSDGNVYATASFRAPIFYDSNDTAYYLNPAGGSRLRNLYVGDSGDDWSDPGGWGTQVRFSNGPHVRFVLHARSPGIEAGMYVHTPGSVYIGSYTSHDVSMMYAGNRKMQITNSYIYTDVYLEAAGSLRAPIFYDSNDTGYYGDFASTSRMNNIILGSTYTPSYQGQLVLGHTSYNFNFLNGSWSSSVTAGILANCADEYEFAIHDSGNSVESLFIYQSSTGRILMGRDIGWGTTPIQAAADFRAPQFRFTNSGNSAYFTGDSSWGARIYTDSGYIWFGPANTGHAHIYTDRPNFYFNADLLVNGATVITTSTIGSQSVSYASSAGNADTVDGYHASGLLKLNEWNGNVYLHTDGRIYGTIFYDANNDGYYLNPNGTSSIVNLHVQGGGFASNAWSSSSGNEAVRVYAPGGASASWDGGITGAFRIKLPQRANNTMWSMTVRIYNYSTNQVSEYTMGNYSYDQGGYNASAHFIGGSNAPVHNVRFGNQDGVDCVWIGETNSSWSDPVVSVIDFQGGFRAGNATTWDDGWNITYVTSFGTVATTIYPNIKVGNLTADGSLYTTGNLYLGGQGSYYLYNSASGVRSNNNLLADGDIYLGTRGTWLSTYLNQNVRTDSSPSFAGLTVSGTTTLNSSVYINRHIDANTGWGSASGNTIFVGWYGGKVVLGNNSNGGHDYASGISVQSVVSTNPFFCYQDITAYSDARVKENVKVVENAVEKIKAIRGVTYTRSDNADKEKRHAGVIAQEVLKVLPEVVSGSEDSVYSVAYGNMAALFIEAIKEQQAQIEDLKNQITELKENK